MGAECQVWDCITPQLASHFTLHLVDLPGYGRSGGFGAMSLEEMAQRVLEQAPTGGLAGLEPGRAGGQPGRDYASERVQALVTVASSPCFAARRLARHQARGAGGFQQQLSEDFQRTVERFLALQTMGTESARQDARALKQAVLSLPMPSAEALNGGLEILRTVDLRQALGCRCRFCGCTVGWTDWCRARSSRSG
jgi:pimeloyl-[acyl-carrier protein] methyl ester esterase